jgi:type II secretory pathway component PulF
MEVADHRFRRFLLRLKVFSETMFPLAFLLLGACVFWIVLAIRAT